jgi:uncharacterized NAD-dependent epimerase/dehydratase family protein
MDGTALVLCDEYFATPNGKTAHGLVRGSERYRVVGLVDPPTAGRDAGEVLDGVVRGIPVFATLGEALAALPERPDFAVVGVATSGGRFTPGLRDSLREALRRRISIVNGLHEFASEDPDLAAEAARAGATITDVRKPPPRRELHFWTGEIHRLVTPRVAVLGTDCAVGKRTTTRLLARACSAAGIRTEWIYTGQTGWMQGARFGILLDSLPNDFVSGELEHAILSCARALSPDLIVIEGQSSLRNPSGPCGSELLLSGGVRGAVLQHAPGRLHFEGLENGDWRIPPIEEEIALIRLYGAETLALTLNGEGLSRGRLEEARGRLERDLGIPAVLPLEEGVDRLVPVLRDYARRESGR